MRENNQTYNQILHEAAALFDQKGFVKTTTREIADAVGINRGHLHYYFAKKEDILACHFAFYEKKIQYFFKQSHLTLDDYPVFFGLVFACQIHTLDSENFSHDLLLLGRYDLDAYFHLMTDSFCEMVLNFANDHGQEVDGGKLKDSIEITLKIAIRLLYIKLSYDKESSFQNILSIALKHGFFQLGFTDEKIRRMLEKTLSIYKTLSMEHFQQIVSRRDYDVLAKEFEDL